MNRSTFERAVASSQLPASSRQILTYLAYKKHWTKQGHVWPSYVTVAKETGLSVATIKRHIPELRDSGWLVDTGRRIGNGAVVYDLAIGNQSHGETSNQSHSDATTGITVRQVVASDESATGIKDEPTGITMSRTGITMIPKEGKNKLEEERTTTSPDGPVVIDSPNTDIKEEADMKPFETCWAFLTHDEKRLFETSAKFNEASEEQMKEAVTLYGNGQAPGYTWREKVENALRKTGVVIEEW